MMLAGWTLKLPNRLSAQDIGFIRTKEISTDRRSDRALKGFVVIVVALSRLLETIMMFGPMVT